MRFCRQTAIFIAAFIMISLAVSADAGSDKDADQMSSPGKTARIIGGDEAGDWPWMTALVERGENNLYQGHLCGGSLIHPRWVVTAAHCAEDETASGMDVVLGIHDLSNDTGERIRIKQIVMHPDYDPVELHSDIALLELAENASHPPIPLISGQIDLTGETALTLGWGVTDTSYYSSPETLQQVSVPIVSDEACRNAFSQDEVTDTMICAGYEAGGKDACRGDSGGPLIVREGDTWRLAGITSWGEGCAEPGYYGVYAKIAVLTDFIRTYVPFLSLTIPATATEGDALLSEQGIVSVQEMPETDILVSLRVDSDSELAVPDTVTISAGQTSAAFAISVLDDTLLDGTQQVVVTAEAPGQGTVTGTIQINDNERATLTLRIPEYATEGDGVLSGQGLVFVSRPVERDVAIFLNSDDIGEVTVPETVTVPAGQSEATFDLTIEYDGEADETQTATVTASLPGWESGTDTIQVAHYEIDFLTEEFVKGNDLSLQTLTFTPDGSGNFYTLCRDEAEQFPTDPDGGTLLPLLDDSYEKVELAQGMQVSLYATSYSSFYVGSDGDIAFESGKNEMDRSLSFHFKGHRISGLLDDLNPEKTKGVTWKQTEDRVAVTYLNIPEYDKPTLLNSFQMELFFDGVIRITYLNISATAGIAGLSRGGGMLAHFSESNLSDYAPCIPLPGDADHNGIIELGDTIRILKMLAGEAEHLHPDADVDGDGKIGITEVIFLLRAIGEGR